MATVTPIVHKYDDIVDEFDVLTNTNSGNGENTLPYINLLKAILVNGYNGKAALGWTIEAEDLANHRIRFRDPANKFTLQIKSANAMGWSTTFDDYSIFTFAENFTDWDTFTNHIWDCSYGAYSTTNYVWSFVGYGSQFVFLLCADTTTFKNNYLAQPDADSHTYQFLTVQRFNPVESTHQFPYAFGGGVIKQELQGDGYYHAVANDATTNSGLKWNTLTPYNTDLRLLNSTPSSNVVVPFNKDGVYSYQMYRVIRINVGGTTLPSGIAEDFSLVKKFNFGVYGLTNNFTGATTVEEMFAGVFTNCLPSGVLGDVSQFDNTASATTEELKFTGNIVYPNGETVMYMKNSVAEDYLDFVRTDVWEN